MNYKDKIYLATKIPFGKYKNKNFYEVIATDVGYAQWLLENPFQDAYIDDRVTAFIRLKIKSTNKWG